MQGALIILAFTILVGLLLYAFDRKGRKNEIKTSEKEDFKVDDGAEFQASDESAGDVSRSGADVEESGECCGMHLVCEKTSLSPVSPEIEYFDDEELDRFRGRDEDSYSDDEIDEFIDVLLTMQPSEVASWSRSLQLRSVVPPTSVRDQILLIVAEQRSEA